MNKNRISDWTGRHVVYPGRELIGTVYDQYVNRDAPGYELRLKVRFFNGEPWPFDPLPCMVDEI